MPWMSEPGDGQYPRVFVAADNATADEKATSDHQCDGVDDHVEILAAVADLPAGGGVIELSSGDFAGDEVEITRSDITVEGQGFGATTYKMQAQTRSVSGDTTAFGFVGSSETRLTGVVIRRLSIDGNKAAMTDDAGGNWQFEGVDFKWVDSGLISVEVFDVYQDGIDLDDCRNVHVVGSYLIDCGGYGVHLGGGDGTENQRNVVAFCYAEGNGFGASSPSRGGFDQNPNSHNTIFIGNVAVTNFRNYNIAGSGATFIGNKSLGSPTEADILTGVSDAGGGVDLSSYPSAAGQPAGKLVETDGSDGWLFIDPAEAGGDLVTVDPGTVTSVIISGDVQVTIESDYGIDSNGDPYFDDTGAVSGEEAALCFRPSDHMFVLIGYEE